MTNARITMVPLAPAAIHALAEGDERTAAEVAEMPLTPFIGEQRWLWQIRSEQLQRSPHDAEWVARLAMVDGEIVGYGGFHAAPDADGMVEVGYSVDPRHRRLGHARAILASLLERAREDPQVLRVRASIRPDNTASLATIAPFGFTEVGEQWDEVDGLETIYEVDVTPQA